MQHNEMPIFTRTFDFLAWLLPATNHFPRAHRHSFTKRLLDVAFDLREQLEEANLRRGQERATQLRLADESLAKVRLYIRLALNLKTAVGLPKSTQVIDAPGKPEKPLITNQVTTRFSDSPCTPISCASFVHPTAVFRLNLGWLKEGQYYHVAKNAG